MPASFFGLLPSHDHLAEDVHGIMVNASRMAAAHPAGGKGTQLNILLIQPNTGTGIRAALTMNACTRTMITNTRMKPGFSFRSLKMSKLSLRTLKALNRHSR